MNRFKGINIGMFETNPGFGGGNIYQKTIEKVLSKKYNIKVFETYPKIFPKAGRPRMLCKIMYLNKKKPSINLWIRNFLGVVGMRFLEKNVKNIALFFHQDYDAIPNKWLTKILDNYFWKNIKKCDEVVVLSKYWKDFLESNGVANVRVIYCGFNISDFSFSPEEINEFKKRFLLTSKPIIYLGNCQEIKGVKEAYLSLKNLPYHLVTSGEREVKIPVLNLKLDYRDYLLLLKSSSAVLTMSKFLEGWNITAHEAMLCKTPVIGSGRGGMQELLTGGRQIISKDYSKLPELVEFAIQNSKKLGNNGYNFAIKFTVKNFEKSWLDLIERL